MDNTLSTFPKEIIVIDNDRDLLESMRIFFGDVGIKIQCFFNEKDFISYIADHPVRLIILDYWLTHSKGGSVIGQLKKKINDNHISTILISADHNIANLAKECGADDFLEKPFLFEHLLKKVRFFIPS